MGDSNRAQPKLRLKATLKIQRLNKAFHFKSLSGDHIFIGDPNESEFKPLFWLKRWGDECHIKLSIGNAVKNLKFNEEDCKVSWDSEIFTVSAYPKERETKISIIEGKKFKYDINELGGLEFEIILKDKPATNIFCFPFETKNLKFYYQPPLTEEFKREECEVYTESYVKTRNGEECFRPPEVVGSYAVYHVLCSSMHNSRENAEKYKCGKAFHIFRPKIIDAEGNEAWCSLNISNGLLKIEIPQDFLDKAVFPLTIDPTFGYTSKGASSVGYCTSIIGTKYSLGESGTAESITVYLHNEESQSIDCKTGIYDGNDNFVSGSDSAKESIAAGYDDWKTFSCSSPPSLSAGTYRLCVWVGGEFGVYMTLYYDSGETEQSGRVLIDSPPDGFPSTFEPDYLYDRKYSIYCAYTTGATQITVSDSAMGAETVTRPHRSLNLAETAVSQELFSRSYRELKIPESALGQELLLKIRNLSLEDIAAGLEVIRKARQVGVITDTAQSLERILKQRLISLLDEAAGVESVTRPTRIIVSADEALSQEILDKLREAAAITDSAIGIEYINVSAEGAVKTRIFLLIGDLAIQVTGD